MATGPTLFLIDGSNQMYRAYHAIRGLTRSDGKSTNATYGFITMLRKLLADHQPQYIARVVRSARADVPIRSGGRLQGQPHADARRSRRAGAVGARGVRGDGRADPHVGGLRGRRCDRDAGDARPARTACRRRSSPATRISFSWSATASASTTRKRRRHVVRRRRRAAEVRRRAGAGVRRARADGRLDRQRQGRARHRREGRARPDRARTDRSSRCWQHAGEIKQKKYREGLLANADQARQSRELVTIRTDVDVPFEAERFRFRGADRERCYALFSKMEFRTLVPEFAPTASSVDEGLRADRVDRGADARWSRR